MRYFLKPKATRTRIAPWSEDKSLCSKGRYSEISNEVRGEKSEEWKVEKREAEWDSGKECESG